MFHAFPQNPNKFGPQSRNLASIIRGYKIGVTKYVRNQHLQFKWQRLYHEHVIRDVEELERIREYISNNPLVW